MARLPDFFIIGAMKSATSTLQRQLDAQAGIHMAWPKEPNFFSDDDVFAKGLDWYSGLFSGARPGDLIGEASTHYTKLPTYPHAVARMRKQVSSPRLIYIMRHPIDRLVSHYMHEWSMGVMRENIDTAIDRHPELVDFGCYAMQLEPYLDTFGPDAVLPVFFDRLRLHPQAELERVCRFIGYCGPVAWVCEYTHENRSDQRVRRFPLYDLLVESELAIWARRSFVSAGWRKSVRERLSLRERPVLSEARHRRLAAHFDNDLQRLGSWLGCSLDCDNFRAVTEHLDAAFSAHGPTQDNEILTDRRDSHSLRRQVGSVDR